jgi:S-methylmethionine-dependent homocysteine/selenocysteine methylase
MSSTKKDQTAPAATTATTAAATSSAFQQQQQQLQQQQQAQRLLQESTERMFDETKQNIQRSIEETRSQIPRYNQAIHNYQEQVVNATGEIATSYIDTQNAIIHAFNASVAPYFENIQNTYRQYYSINPQNVQEFYSQTVSNIANNSVTVVRLVNNTIFTNFDLLKSSWQQATDNVKEISRVTSNTARAFGQSNKEEVSSVVANNAGISPTNA